MFTMIKEVQKTVTVIVPNGWWERMGALDQFIYGFGITVLVVAFIVLVAAIYIKITE